ncbi:glycosyl hydrolase family 95 catalytic domain-containing protein [uncultured Ruminococcus sp.]|uniref:glycosyl hydrolase family 95 catalytic domain-containing protein n=1 Tax=uncultured Ruminococcus sp. TaxID=165186 RepID=UPI0037DC872D
MATHIIEHYEYTMDKVFLARYYYLMHEAALFFVDFLVPCDLNAPDGKPYLVINPSLSPENSYVTKTGEADGDEADFYGENAAIFATNGGTLNLSEMVVKTDGKHANAVFSYGEGTTVNISDSYINTTGNCSGGLMTTGGGTMNAANLTIETSGNSSAAIRSDRGGGTVNVNGGYYSTSGTGSPVIYSTADITVSDAEMVSTASQGVVVEGKNSVTLNNVTLTADNNKKNSDKSSYYQAVMIYQSMSGDAAQGLSGFTMNGGSLVNKNGDVFFVNNTATEINLSDASITNEGDGVFLRAAAAGWGKEGSNGGQVTLNAEKQTINGDMLVDSVSTLNLYLKSGSNFTGAINPDGAEGSVYVEVEKGSTWTLTADSYISSLTCDADSINLNGHKLYVDGKEYTEGTASQGEAIEIKVSTSSGGHEAPPDGGGAPGGNKPEGNPPAKPD